MHPEARQQRAKDALISDLKSEGFTAVAVTHPGAIPEAQDRLVQALNDGHHATMQWMRDTRARRGAPRALWSEVRSIIMVAMNYGPENNLQSLENIEKPDRGTISVYAQNRDYHDVVKGKLKQAAGRFAARNQADVKVFVDTAPVMEKPLAQAAGLGWQGKHTNLVSTQIGSWFFLGSIFTDMALPFDQQTQNHCGSCSACLDACPTDAFPAPYRLDANRCISYLTIEHKGLIPEEFRVAMGNRIYGCDDCLSVCPWNKFAKQSSEAKLIAREDLKSPKLADLLALDDAAFRTLFSGSPIKRIGRNRFVRNCLIAAGNSGDRKLIAHVRRHLTDPDHVVSETAKWAQSRIGELSALARLETDCAGLDRPYKDAAAKVREHTP
ncbi:MAG: tRNA epoxyqueuosine(34) reductase QueG [Pseudomonadota bacterium]